ncbi:MAG TPA: GEVED domain-containing protein [Flavobacterium sp.]|jgi:hypothetical protein
MNFKLLSSSKSVNKPTVLLLKSLLLCAFFVLGNQTVKAQEWSAYVAEQLQITPAYTDLAVKTPIHTGVWDNGVTSVPIGFTFQFNGINYTTTNVSSNGFITFGTTAPAATLFTPISSTTAYAGAISGYGRDLLVTAAAGTPQANNVSYFLDTSGGAGNSIFKVEYRAVKRNSGATADSGNISFQIWLYQTTNVIEIRYGIQTTGFGANITGEVGLRGPSNSEYYNFAWGTTANWPGLPATMTTAGNANTATVGIRSAAPRIVTASNRLFRFTPANCSAPSGLAVSNVAASTATATWTAPSTVPSGYQYYLSTSSTAPTASTTQTGTSATNSLSLSSLLGNTTYCLWVRSDCGGSTSNWTASACFTTLCTAVNIPYFLYFDPFTDGFAVPGLPACTSVQQVGTGNLWVTDATAEEGFFDEHLMYNASGGSAANVWFFTRGINVVAGSTYRLSYTYGGSTNFSFITNKMMVSYGSSPQNSAMTTQLADHPNIKQSPLNNVVNFTATTTGTIYIGFKAYSAANMGRLFVDDIDVTPAVCRPMAAATVGSISYNSAVASWTPPTPTPAFGYSYYLVAGTNVAAASIVAGNTYVITSVGTTNFTLIGAAANTVGTTFVATAAGTGTGTAAMPNATAPLYSTPATGSTSSGVTSATLTGLTGSTLYFLWVRGNCGAPDMGEWSPVVTFVTNATPPYCIPNAATNTTTTAINNVKTTNAVTNVNNSSAFIAPGYSDYTSLLVTESQNGTFNFSVGFQAGGGVGVAIWIDWNGDGTFSTAERMYNSASYLFTSPATGTITVPAGATLGVTRMRVVADYYATNPDPCTLASGTGGTRGEIEDYSFKVISPPPALGINITSSTQCASTNSPVITLTSPVGNFDTYTWSPAGVTGNATTGWTINSATSLTYTLTGTRSNDPDVINSASFVYTANPLPTPITITAASGGTVCQTGPAIALTASGGVVSGVPVYSEDFNTGATGWTEQHCTIGTYGPACAGNWANSVWTVRPNGYAPTGGSWFGTTLTSNDNTSFYFSDADSQGIGNGNDNLLISPVFNLTGYTAASLSFWHFYRDWTPSEGKVEISTNGGTSYTTLATYDSNQGTTNVWQNVIIDLNAYAGMSNLRIRFNYQARWGWGWGIDNFVVSGSATSAITWTPITGLYSDAAATTPYVAGTGTITVYAMPSTNTTYTASASTPAPTVCSTSTATSVTVIPIVGGSVTPTTQAACGIASALTLGGGYSGTIARWEWSTSPTFVSIGGTIANTTTTLTPAQIGVFAGTRYFRAVITNGACTAYSYAPASPTYASITFDSTTWNGTSWNNGTPNAGKTAIFAGNYTATSNLVACSVVINSGNVLINSNRTLTITNSVTVSGGSLTFNNDASLVQINDAAVNSGNIIYKRNSEPMFMYDFTYWSSPVYPQTLANFSPLTLSDKYFWWNPTIYNWQSITAPGITTMTQGQGYIIRAPQGYSATVAAAFAGQFTGVPNNGIITRPIVVAGANNLNLLGNPYPSAIDADLFLSSTGPNAGVLEGTIYFWTHNTAVTNNVYDGDDYAVYNLSGGVGTGTAGGGTGNSFVPDGDIAAGQAFFAKGSANGTATFNNSMRISGNNSDFFKVSTVQTSPQSLEKHRIWLEIKNAQGAYKQTLVGYIQNATDERDRDFDGDLVDAGNPVGLYSLLGTDKLSIQGRALPFVVNDEVPIGYKSAAGNFEIALSNFDGLFLNQDIFLEDKLLNVIHNLKAGNYSFTTLAGTFNDRFVLRFTDGGALGTDANVFNENSVVVYKNETGIHINTSNTMMSGVKIFDIRGRLILDRKDINSNEAVINGLRVEQQVLVIQITSEDKRTVTRKIVY